MRVSGLGQESTNSRGSKASALVQRTRPLTSKYLKKRFHPNIIPMIAKLKSRKLCLWVLWTLREGLRAVRPLHNSQSYQAFAVLFS